MRRGEGNKANGKTTGWTMTNGASVITENNTGGTRFPDYNTICAGHGSISAFNAVFTQTHSDVTTTTFNGTNVSIVVTPYVAPAV